jgi:sugar lactone lactonase YvrE
VGLNRRLIGLVSLIALTAIAAAMLGLELPRPPVPEPSMPPVYVSEVAVLARLGVGELPEGEFAFMAIEPNGNVLVTDRVQRTIRRFDARGVLLKEWGPQLTANVWLGEPAGLAVAGDRRYVLDRGQARILRFDAEGRVQGIISLEALSTYGLNGLAVDAAGNLFVADTGRSRILVISPTGTLLRQLGRAGSELGDFIQPMTLAFAPDGSFFVADWENSRVQRWDATAYRATTAWSTDFRPFGVAVDALGRVFVPDAERRRIQVFTPGGTRVAEIGAAGSPALETLLPSQVAVTGDVPPRLFVLGRDALLRVELADAPPPR